MAQNGQLFRTSSKVVARTCVTRDAVKRDPCRHAGASSLTVHPVYASSLTVHPEVQAALDCGRPVVALETTIVTHGMPYPHNVQTALQVEDIIRSHGVVPATIGIVRGQVIVGQWLHNTGG